MQNLPRGASPPYFNYQLTMRHYPMANSVKRRPASPEALAQPALPHVFSFNPPTNLPSYLKNHPTSFPSSAVSIIPRNYPRFPKGLFFRSHKYPLKYLHGEIKKGRLLARRQTFSPPDFQRKPFNAIALQRRNRFATRFNCACGERSKAFIDFLNISRKCYFIKSSPAKNFGNDWRVIPYSCSNQISAKNLISRLHAIEYSA